MEENLQYIAIPEDSIPAREDRISWDDHHMSLALITSLRSPDPNTAVGACVVSQDNRILGLGYNGTPRSMGVNRMPWNREDKDPKLTKYMWVVHAEENAILNSNKDLVNAKIYCTLAPCNECAKTIVQSGISEVVYLSNPYANQDSTQVARMMFNEVDIKFRAHKWTSSTRGLLTQMLSANIG